MSEALITRVYGGQPVSFTEAGWFNATVAAAKFGKVPNEWLRLPATRNYLEALERKYGKFPHFETRRGAHGGTWLHPRLAVVFARWLDDDFAVWCDECISEIMRSQQITAEYLPGYHELHDLARRLAQGSVNERFVHMNLNKLVNRTAGISPGQRRSAPPARRARLIVAQEAAINAMAHAPDHHVGYQCAKRALDGLAQFLEGKPPPEKVGVGDRANGPDPLDSTPNRSKLGRTHRE